MHRDEGISNSEHTDVPRKVWNKENLLLCLAKIHKFYVLPTHCIYVFCVDLRTNSDYFTVQH